MAENQSGGKELAKFAYELGQEGKTIVPVKINQENFGAQLALVPEGQKVVNLLDYLPTRPARKQAGLKFYDAASFVAYVNEQKSDATRIFASIRQEPYEFKAIIDWHERAGGSADWCQHIATLNLALSEQFRTWRSHDGDMMSQTEFAEFIKDNRFDVLEPSGAAVLQLAMELEATAESKCVGKVRTNDGMTVSFSESVNASVGGQKVDIPEKLTLKMPVFEGMDAQEIVCDFKFRPVNGGLLFGFRMLGVDKMLRDAVKAAQLRISTETELPVYV